MFSVKKTFIFSFILILAVLSLLGFTYTKFRKDKIAGARENNSNGLYPPWQIEQKVGELDLARKMSAGETSFDSAQIEANGVERGIIMSSKSFTHSARLADVTGGAARGIVKAGFTLGRYSLSADFANLLAPANGDFYEGWLVQREPFAFISTGRVDRIGGTFTNLYVSNNNLLEYNLYVLTLEPSDNDPAPNTHVLEGLLMEINENKY